MQDLKIFYNIIQTKTTKRDKYIGNWHDNKRNGKGIYKSQNGMVYDGSWVNDKPDGEGKEEWEDGNTYIGSYSKGKKKTKKIKSSKKN